MAKIKGSQTLNIDGDAYCVIWEGCASDFARNFCLRASYGSKYFLYQDGYFMGWVNAVQIYPFAKDPTKKEPLFGKRGCRMATVIGISTDFQHRLSWGTPSATMLMDSETNQMFTVGMSGTLYFSISDDPMDVKRFCAFRGLAADNDIKEKIRDIIRHVMPLILNESGYTLKQFQNMRPVDYFQLSQACYQKLNDAFMEYGIRPDKTSISSLIACIVVNEA